MRCRLRDPVSGRYMKMYTTMPGVQLYTSNFLDGSVVGKEGVAYPQHSAVCLEAQFYPDAINQVRRETTPRAGGPYGFAVVLQ